jgi:hypothetical protein
MYRVPDDQRPSPVPIQVNYWEWVTIWKRRETSRVIKDEIKLVASDDVYISFTFLYLISLKFKVAKKNLLTANN